tara:strand:- start:58 stop:519 length:462 start_codon:yes stop_codon:yes gene_type:complete
MENEIRLIVKIPHQFSVRTWVAYNDTHIINHAVNGGFLYELWTKEKAIDVYGEEDEIPDDLLSELKENEKIIQVCFRDYHEGDFYTEYDAPTELEAAKDCISYDLQNCYFLTVPEAEKFINEYRGHKRFEVIEAVKHELKSIFWRDIYNSIFS